MALLKKLVIGFFVLALAFVGIGFLLPSEYTVDRSITIDAPPHQVYEQIVDLQNWRKWGVWFQRDPNMTVNYTGPVGEVGMKSAWISETEGSGEMQLLTIQNNQSLTYSLYFPDLDMGSTGEITLTEDSGKTQVLWSNSGDVGSNPLYHYMAAMMDSMIGPDFEAGLANLKTLVESQD